MLKKLFFVFAALLIIVFSLLVFRYFYLKGMLGFGFQSSPRPSLSLSPSPFPSPVDSSLPLFTPSIGPSLSPTPAQKGKLVTVDVDDIAAGMYVINVASGTKVTFTINVVNFNVLHGGLDLRSEKISTGNVLPGSSKTVEFIFDKNLIFTPFYFDTNTAAPYTIKFNLI
ncbi:MAG: hypothetical protein A2418_01225 [Candidatus Brennerbacteria bacterium RIFOXYC1_FULL_41_11]|nr:MAG: hypothetical protein A2418_01225 [Candidatus Brennerbacteria bacterium RIFOXYC1_FULL_41_11]